MTFEMLGDPPNTAVPTHFFKVILGVKQKENVTALGGFVVPNEAIGETPLTEFIVPVDGRLLFVLTLVNLFLKSLIKLNAL